MTLNKEDWTERKGVLAFLCDLTAIVNLRFSILGSLDGTLKVDFCHRQFTRALSEDAWDLRNQFHKKEQRRARGASDARGRRVWGSRKAKEVSMRMQRRGNVRTTSKL